MDKFALEAAKLIGVQLTDYQIEAFRFYENELIVWNDKFNLTAIKEIPQIRSKHFLDSLTCFLAFGEKIPRRLIDVGTGAGFPGLPIKILFPKVHLTLVESIGKKARFCEHIVTQLNLENVTVIQSRAEDLGRDPKFREKFDWAVARAVANLPTLVEYLLPLVRIGGAVIAQKGESAHAEAHKSDQAIHVLGGRLRQLLPVTIPGVAEERYLVIIDKIAATPKSYPRNAGMPAKKPLG
jgi:16S rRNA (guanine527-N7)-methyltransferase